jgi:hypothetical protein
VSQPETPRRLKWLDWNTAKWSDNSRWNLDTNVERKKHCLLPNNLWPTSRNTALIGSQQLLSQSKIPLSPFMEPQGPLPCSEGCATGPYSEPDEYSHPSSFKIHSNLHFNPWVWCLAFRSYETPQ